jgi:hypothetical protein
MRASRVPDAPGCAGYGHPGVIGTFLLQMAQQCNGLHGTVQFQNGQEKFLPDPVKRICHCAPSFGLTLRRKRRVCIKTPCSSFAETGARCRCALAMGISVGHVQPQLLIGYGFKGQSGPPFETRHPTITHPQRHILKPKIDTWPVNLTSRRASPSSGQIHRPRWLSLPAKVIVAEQKEPFARFQGQCCA